MPNRLDRSAALRPITSGFSPPRYNVVLVGCRHPRAVPLAFRVSAQFDGLAHMSVPTWQASSHMHRRTKGACRSRLIGLPAHAASRAHPRHHHADRGKGTAGGTPAIPVQRPSPRCPTPSRKSPLSVTVRVKLVVVSGCAKMSVHATYNQVTLRMHTYATGARAQISAIAIRTKDYR